MVNYSNTKIYKIWSTQGPMIYVGSTTKEYLSQRMDTHRGQYKHWKSGKTTKITTSFKLFDEYGFENCMIELLEAKSCSDNHEKIQLEAKHIRELDCVNKVIPGRTRADYRKDNKDKIKEYQDTNKDRIQEYREANKEKIQEQRKGFREANKDKIKAADKAYKEANKDKIRETNKIYCELNKEKIRDRQKAYNETNQDKLKEKRMAYREANKDKIKERKKQYYEANKDKIKERQTKKQLDENPSELVA